MLSTCTTNAVMFPNFRVKDLRLEEKCGRSSKTSGHPQRVFSWGSRRPFCLLVQHDRDSAPRQGFDDTESRAHKNCQQILKPSQVGWVELMGGIRQWQKK